MRGLILIGFGILYLIKPTIFRTGIWLKTSNFTNSMSPEKFEKYMKILAVIFIVIGLIILILDNQAFFIQENVDNLKNLV